MAVLVVVDMQPDFDAATDLGLQARIRNRIRAHNERGDLVALLEYEGYRPTYPGIRKAARENPRFYDPRTQTFMTMTKDEDDGSAICEVLRKMGHARQRIFIVCGVNTGYCVLDTARGILKDDKRNRVILPLWCCRTWYDEGEHRTTEQLIYNFVRDNPKRAKMLRGRQTR